MKQPRPQTKDEKQFYEDQRKMRKEAADRLYWQISKTPPLTQQVTLDGEDADD